MMEQKMIYLLEDDPGIQELVTYLLTANGYAVEVFGKVGDFTDKLKNNSPDLFLLDVTLPDGNGLDLSKALAGNTSHKDVPIVIMSANGSNQVTAAACGARSFISKPFDIDAFIDKIKSILVA